VSSPRPGITLLEVLVALTVTVVVVATARMLIDAVDGHGRAAVAAMDRRLHITNAEDGMARLVRLAAIPVDTQNGLRGQALRVRLPTRCRHPRGFDAPCVCQLTIQPARVGAVLDADCGATRYSLLEDSTGLAFRYLTDPGLGGQWQDEWTNGRRLPFAIGVIRVHARDTLLFPAGVRG
jgi:hypothetical protein